MLSEIKETILKTVKQYREKVKDIKGVENQVTFILTQSELTGYILGYFYTSLIKILGKKEKKIAESIVKEISQGPYGEHLTILISLLLLEDIPQDKIPDEMKRIVS